MTAVRTVMVIDDSGIARASIVELLRAAGFETHERETPIGATADLFRLGVDAVVLDMNMPVMSGERFAKLVRANDRLAGIAIVLVTGERVTDPPKVARELGAVALIGKRDIARQLVPALRGVAGRSEREAPADREPLFLRAGTMKVVLSPGVLVIGRGEDAQIVVDEPGVSRTHARLVVGARDVRIRDAGSRTGTFVNGRRLAEETTLSLGDEITIGTHRLVLDGGAARGRAKATLRSIGEAETARIARPTTQEGDAHE